MGFQDPGSSLRQLAEKNGWLRGLVAGL
jgi:hypothetical protein